MRTLRQSLIALNQWLTQQTLAPTLSVGALSFLAAGGIFLLFFLPLLLFIQTPLVHTNWGLQDPAVSNLNFSPGVKVLRFELLHHFNILWTALRNMGTSILANEVQVAPLFPLNWLYIWFPERFYWPLMVSTRVILAGVGTFLIASQCLKLSRVQSFVFMLTFCFAMCNLRWMNHPWQNGWCAGIWLLYCLLRLLELLQLPKALYTAVTQRTHLALFFGLAVAVYALITCGFPEATIMSLCLACIVVTPLMVLASINRPALLKTFLPTVLVAGIIGLCFGAIQIFALHEYVHLTHAHFRSTLGLAQYHDLGAIWEALMPTNRHYPNVHTIHIFGLIPTFLFCWGLFKCLLQGHRINRYEGIALLAGAFFLLKYFSIWPWFNELIGSLPLLNQCWFTTYFSPVFLWFFAYFAAQGIACTAPSPHQRSLHRGLFYLTLSLLGVCIFQTYTHSVEIQLHVFLRHLLLFSLFIVLFGYALFSKTAATYRPIIQIGMMILLTLDVFLAFPAHFSSYTSSAYEALEATPAATQHFNAQLSALHLDLTNTRELSENGRLIGMGVANIDNGAPAILTARATAFRNALFESDWEGYLPIRAEKVPYALALASVSLQTLTSEIPRAFPPPAHDERPLSTVMPIKYDRTSLSRAYTPTRCIEAASMQTAVQRLKNPTLFSLGEVVVEAISPQERVLCQQFQAPLHAVPIEQDHGSWLQLQAIQGPTILVLNDSFYPGWFVEDRLTHQRLSIRPANVNFRAVFLPEHRLYQLQFYYQPKWLWWSYGLCGFGLLLSIGVLLARKKLGALYSRLL